MRRRDEVRAAVERATHKVMVCGANWNTEHADKRRAIADCIRDDGENVELIIPELDPPPTGVSAAQDEAALARDCDTIIILIEPAEAARGSWGEVATFQASVPGFADKALIFVPESVMDRVEQRSGFHEDAVANHPEDRRVVYTAAQYDACGLRVRAQSFFRSQRISQAQRIYGQMASSRPDQDA